MEKENGNENSAFELYARASAKFFLGGDFPGALEGLEEAERLARHSGMVDLLILILVLRAGVLRESGQAQKGHVVLAEAEDLLLHVPADTPAEARSLDRVALRLEQGIVARSAGDFPAAGDYLREAEAEARGLKSGGELVLSDVLANLASLHLDQGKTEMAQSALMEAVSIDRQFNIYGRLSNDLNMLGVTYNLLGDHDTAKSYWKQAMEEAERSGNIKQYLDSTCNTLSMLEQEGRLGDADSAFRQIYGEYLRIGNRREAANVKSDLAILASQRDDFARARTLFEEAHREHEAAGLRNEAVKDLLNQATMEMSAGRNRIAYELASRANTEVEARGLLEVEWLSQFLVARTRAACLSDEPAPGHAVQAVQALRDEVLPRYKKAADVIELLRSGVGRPEEREYLLKDKEQIYGEAVLLAATLGKAADALMFSERARARAFLDIMGARRLERSTRGHPLAWRRQELTQQIVDLSEREAPREQLAPLLEELRLTRSQIVADAPDVDALTEAHIPDLEAICGAIPKETALVEFFFIGATLLCTFVLTDGGLESCTVVDLGSYDLALKVAQFRAELEYEAEGVPTGWEIFNILFAQIWDVIDPMERLVIVPHQHLHLIPFSALWFNNSGSGPSRLFLCQRFYLSVLPSAAFLPICLRIPRPNFKKGRALVLGNPTGDLPAAEAEAGRVASHLGVKPLVRGLATRSVLLKAPPELGVIHITSHGEYNPLDPLLSGVRLADGLLTVEDLMENRIQTGLLALSGCVTGLFERRPGDELIGLPRAAASSGIPSVITTLWPIRDKSTCLFFEAFYDSLSRGESKDHSMLIAQKTLIATKEFNAPIHWAAFVLMGDWR